MASPTTHPRLRFTPTKENHHENSPHQEAVMHSSSSTDTSPSSSPLRTASDLFKDGSHHHKGSSNKTSTKQQQQHRHFSVVQVVTLVALGASVSAILTALLSVHIFSQNPQTDGSSDWTFSTTLLTHASSGLRSSSSGTISKDDDLSLQKKQQQAEDDSTTTNSRVVWLMSFPNSGTSFTIHMTREATNCTTATNYGLEGEIRDKPSEQAIPGPAGRLGPWLELIPNRTTNIANTILTKTHCKGFCSGSYCGPEKTFHTPRSFTRGCLTGNQGVEGDRGLRLRDATYDKSLVKKAIHLFRHPLDNVVARFHLEYNEKKDAGDTKYTKLFPKNSLGFRRWCAVDDMNKGVLKSRFIDRRLHELMVDIPCRNEFFRYTQWHNLAFITTRDMQVETMILHYHEYSDDFVKAREKVLNFIELPRVGEGIEFHDGKVYRDYYSRGQRKAIRTFLQEFASAETWEQLKGYDFETELSPSAPVTDFS